MSLRRELTETEKEKVEDIFCYDIRSFGQSPDGEGRKLYSSIRGFYEYDNKLSTKQIELLKKLEKHRNKNFDKYKLPEYSMLSFKDSKRLNR